MDLVVYRKRVGRQPLGRAVRFFIMNNVLLLARLPVFQLLVDRGLQVLVANGITLVLLFVVRFVVATGRSSPGRGQHAGPTRCGSSWTRTRRPGSVPPASGPAT